MDFSEKPSGKELSVKERRFVGQSCECWGRCEEGDRKGMGTKGRCYLGITLTVWEPCRWYLQFQRAPPWSAGTLPRPPQGHPLAYDSSVSISLFSKSQCWTWGTWSFILILFSNVLIMDTFSFPGLIFLTTMKWNFTPNSPWGRVFSGVLSRLSKAILQMWQVPSLDLSGIQGQMILMGAQACLTDSPLLILEIAPFSSLWRRN